MKDTIRQRIVDDFEKRMKTIKRLNGYQTDMGLNIFVNRTTDWQESELEGCDIRDGDEEVEAAGAVHSFTLDMDLEVKVKGSASDRYVRRVIADITVAVGKAPKFSDLIDTVKPVSIGSPDFEHKDRKFGTIDMKFKVNYRTRAFDPYNNV
jgi:hypothetical protein